MAKGNEKVGPKIAGVAMWSPKGNQPDGSTHIGLTTGHTFIIPHDKAGIVVPSKFRKDAIARGCLPVGMEPEEEEAAGFDRKALIRAKIEEMKDSDEANAFTVDGKPNLTMLAKLCGFQLERSEVSQVWNSMTSDDDGEETVSVGAA